MEYLVYFTIFLVPILVDKAHWFPFSTQKSIFIIGSAFVMLILLSWGLLRRAKGESWKMHFSWLHLALLIYFSALTLSALFGVDVANSFFGRYEQSLSLVLLYALAVFALVVEFLARNRKNFLQNILAVSFASSVVVAVVSYFSLNSTLGNDSYVGAYLLFNLCFGLGLFLNTSKIWKRILIACGILSVALSPVFFNQAIWSGKLSLSSLVHDPLLLVGSAMGAALGLVVAIAFATVLFVYRSGYKYARVIGGVLFGALIGLMIFVGCGLNSPTSSIHQKYVAEKSGSRFLFWGIAGEGFADSPALGSGYGNYYDTYQKHFNPEVMSYKYTEEMWLGAPHNAFLEYMSTTGVAGTLSFVILFGSMLFILFKKSKDEEGRVVYVPIFLFGALIGYFVQNLFVFDTPTTYLMFFLVLGVCLAYVPIKYNFSINNKVVKAVVLAFVIIGSILGFIYLAFYPWQESKAWQKLATNQSIVKLPQLVSGIQDISGMGNVRDTAYMFDKFYGLLESSVDQVNKDNKSYVLASVDSLVKELEKEMKGNAGDFRAHLVAGKLLNLHSVVDGQVDEDMDKRANEHFESALKINPVNPTVYLALAQTRFIEHDLSGAQAYTKAAMELSPEYKPAYDFATNLEKVFPDKKFEIYINTMRAKWTPQ